ncbi:hypothetical protein NT6N_12470 [Oceaniferula spumae]|uniref:Prepilin-type N-terminal cleavage/methylation domain-containing protein n=1 Tax=Oceaniferula spumae TaxID=2979115 RepID=A0AAT9FJT4_9BACT
MNTKTLKSGHKGFTLIELLVAMSITVILLGVLVYMTGISMDTYRDSRNEVRASRQAKEALSTIAKDFESMVSRRDGNNYEWLYAGEETSSLKGPSQREITNTSRLIFFTGATDRYNGAIGTSNDKGGDVSAVSYRLVYRDQISDSNDEEHAVFTLYRHLVNPDEAFKLLAVEDLEQAYTSDFSENDDLSAANFLVENIYEFSVTFLIEVTVDQGGAQVTHTVRATMSPSNMTEFRLKGSKIEYSGDVEFASGSGLAQAQIENGRIVGVDISITVLSDQGLTLAKKSGISRQDLVKQHGYHYSKSITTPRP